MTEIYPDAEIEEVKEWLKNAPPNSNRRWMNGEWLVYERLIATVDFHKADKETNAAELGQIITELKKVIEDKTGTIKIQGQMIQDREGEWPVIVGSLRNELKEANETIEFLKENEIQYHTQAVKDHAKVVELQKEIDKL